MSQDPYTVYRTIARLGSVLLMLLGTLVLLGWFWNVELLTSVLPGRMSMKPNTAIGFVFLGVALFLLSGSAIARLTMSRRTQLICAAFAAIAMLVGSSTFFEYLLRTDLRIDQLLFRDLSPSLYPGRMSYITAFNLFIAGLGVCLFSLSEKRANLCQSLAAVSGLSGLFAIIGYTYGVSALPGSIHYTAMALPTAVGFLVCSLSILFCHPDRGLMSVLTNSYPGGWLVGKLLPVAALAPAALGAVCIHSWLFSSDARLSIVCLVAAQIVLFMGLVWILGPRRLWPAPKNFCSNPRSWKR
jgi:hypothetical protein